MYCAFVHICIPTSITFHCAYRSTFNLLKIKLVANILLARTLLWPHFPLIYCSKASSNLRYIRTRQTDRQTGWQTYRQTDRPTDRQSLTCIWHTDSTPTTHRTCRITRNTSPTRHTSCNTPCQTLYKEQII